MQSQVKAYFVVLILMISCNNHVRCTTLNDVKALRKQLFVTNDYDKFTRPVVNQSEVSIVRISMGIYLVFELDEVAQTLRVAGFLDITWWDEALVWEPAQYGGLDASFFPQDYVWRPDVSLKDSVDDFKALGDSALNVHVTNDGHVTWQPYHLFSSYCSIDITYYPFDEQQCVMTFVTWGYDKSQIVIQGPPTGEAVTLANMQQNAEWDLVRVTCEATDDPKPMMLFYLTLKRKPRTVIFDVILPLFVLTLVNVSAFLIPVGSGERSGYTVTLFLSFIVYTSIVSASLPANSDSTCYLSVYIIAHVCQSAIITIISLLSIRMSTRETPDSDCHQKYTTSRFSWMRSKGKRFYSNGNQMNADGQRGRRVGIDFPGEFDGSVQDEELPASPPCCGGFIRSLDGFFLCLFTFVSIAAAVAFFILTM